MMNAEMASDLTGARVTPKGRVGADGCCPRCGAPMESDLRLPGIVCSAKCGFEVQDYFD